MRFSMRPYRLLPVLAVEAGERVADLVPRPSMSEISGVRRHQALRALDGQWRLGGDGGAVLEQPASS